MSSNTQNIVAIISMLLLISIPLMPTLIYGMYSFDTEGVEVMDMGSIAEEEDEKFHSVADSISYEFSAEVLPARVFCPSEIAPPDVETHSPPPDLS